MSRHWSKYLYDIWINFKCNLTLFVTCIEYGCNIEICFWIKKITNWIRKDALLPFSSKFLLYQMFTNYWNTMFLCIRDYRFWNDLKIAVLQSNIIKDSYPIRLCISKNDHDTDQRDYGLWHICVTSPTSANASGLSIRRIWYGSVPQSWGIGGVLLVYDKYLVCELPRIYPQRHWDSVHRRCMLTCLHVHVYAHVYKPNSSRVWTIQMCD